MTLPARVWTSFNDELQKLAKETVQDAKRWSSVVIESPVATLTKRDVFNYYQEPKVRNALLKELEGREAIVRQSFTPEFVVLKRKEDGKLIRIDRAGKDVDDPSDMRYFTERRVTEFHPVFHARENRVMVDLDPRPGFSLEETKGVVRQVAELVGKMPDVTSTEVRYSGGRGFYVIGNLSKPLHVDRGRRMLRETLAPLTEADERVTFGVPAGQDQIRIDVNTFKRRGSLRGLYSLNANTGLVSVPVEDLDAFDPYRDATIEAVLGREPRKFTHVR